MYIYIYIYINIFAYIYNDSNKSSKVNIADNNRDINNNYVKDIDNRNQSSNGNRTG